MEPQASPVGVSTVRGDPTASSWFSAYRFLTNAPSDPSCAGTLPEPADHFMATTFGRFSSTPLTVIDLPLSLPSAVADLRDDLDAVAFAAAAAALLESGASPRGQRVVGDEQLVDALRRTRS